MQSWITEVMEQFGYLGIFFMVTLENVFPPIPSEIILPFGGFMTTYTGLTIPWVIASATAGSVAGAAALYGIGNLFDVETLEKIVGRWGRFLRVKVEDIHKAAAWFDRYGPWAVFFCRMIPLVRSLISIPAGMSNMHFGLFLLLTAAGTLIWNTVLVSAGAILGQSWEDILQFLKVYSVVTYAVLGVAAAAFIVLWASQKKRRRTNALRRDSRH
ncbi:MAG: DedA family protein [Dehalococcoidia bacterium]